MRNATTTRRYAGIAPLLALTITLAVVGVRPLAAATIDVFPGPGTPLQDAINAAAPGDKLVLHGGTFAEAIVIDKALKLYAASGVRPVIDATGTLGFAVDIAADNVSMKGSGPVIGAIPLNPITIKCGASGGIRIHNRTGVKLQRVEAGTLGGCDSGAVPVGLDILASDQVKLTLVSMFGDIACHVRQEAAGSRILMKEMFCSGITAAAQFEDIAPGASLGHSGVKVVRGTFSGQGTSSFDGMKLINADGIRLTKSFMSNGGGSGIGLDLDAGSDRNSIEKNIISGGAADAGVGNCWRNNTGTGIPTSCP